MPYYFAYGSNMNPARVETRGLNIVSAQAANLPGFRLTFNKMSKDHAGIGHANIEFARGETVEGVIYQLAHGDEIYKMDPFERAPINYGRERVRVHTANESLWTWTYFANAAVCTQGLLPSPEYLAHLLAGKPFLSAKYYAGLQAWSRRANQHHAQRN